MGDRRADRCNDRNVASRARPVRVRRAWIKVLSLAAISAGFVACDRQGDSARALFRESQSRWASNLAVLRAEQEGLSQRISELSAREAQAGQSARVSVEPLLNGVRQAIGTVNTQCEQSESRIGPALKEGGEAAAKALDAERQRIDESLRMMKEQLDSADQELSKIERT